MKCAIAIELYQEDAILYLLDRKLHSVAGIFMVSLEHDFNGSQLAKIISRFLTCPCHKIHREEAVGRKSSNYTLKIVIFVNM